VHRRALRDGLYTDTVVTRAFSGRYARGLRNRFASEHEDAPAAYPEIHHLTRPLRVAATAAGDPDVPNLWAGTGWRQISAEPAGAVVRRVAAEARNRP
jgi:nitronate monooxygenase